MTHSELKMLNAGDVHNRGKTPIFEPILQLAHEKHVMLNLEIKEYFSEENEKRCIKCIEYALALVEKNYMAENMVINSFDAWILEYVYKKYGRKYMLHGFYPYDIMRNVSINPDEYLYCACIFDTKKKRLYGNLIEKNIEPWIGASVTQESLLDLCSQYGAKLITTNNPHDVLMKLQKLGLRDK